MFELEKQKIFKICILCLKNQGIVFYEHISGFSSWVNVIPVNALGSA